METHEPVTKEEIRSLLQSFESEDGKYKTIELIQFLNSFVFNEKKEDAFYQEQVYENMNPKFSNSFDENNLLDFISKAKYIPLQNEGNEEIKLK
jgi:hypothetical protein